MKILIAEDDNFLSGWMVSKLQEKNEVLYARDGFELLTLLAEKPDLILCDIGMPNKSGDDAIRAMRYAKNQTPVIVLTQFKDAVLYKSIRKLVQGYRIKDLENIDKLIDEINNFDGELYEPSYIVKMLLENQREDLTPAENRFLQTSNSIGGDVKKVAKALFVSEKTVRQYRYILTCVKGYIKKEILVKQN